MNKKIISIISVVLIVLISLTSCGKTAEQKAAEETKKNIKVGIVLTGDEKDVYSNLHLTGFNAMKESAGLKDDRIIIKKSIKAEDCYKTAAELADSGCTVVFAAGDGIEDYIVQAATEKTGVQFCYADGKQAFTSGISNYYNYSVKTFEARYLSGVATGMKLNDMIENGEISESQTKLGYIGSTAGSASRSDYTAFYLGAKSVCKSVTMEVQYSGLNNSANLERIAANALMANGCIMIAQQGYLNGAAETCEKNGKYFIGCDSAATDKAPNFAIASTTIDWTATYTYAVNTLISGQKLPSDWSKGSADDSIGITEINKVAFSAENKATAVTNKVNEIKTSLKDGKIKVFDNTKWTVNKEKVTTTVSDELNSMFSGKEYISKDGYFTECETSSYPQFNFVIDGITELNA